MLSLARWDNEQGSSSGWWLVREIPGLCICRSHPSPEWIVQAVQKRPPHCFNFPHASQLAWGKEPDLQQAELLLENAGHAQRRFASRRLALHWVEGLLEKPAPAVLGEML